MTRTTGDWLGNLVAFTLTIVVNAMATSLPLGGQTPPEISAKYPSLFTPAGFTFSIWGLIYFCLTLFIIYQALPSQRDNAVLKSIGTWFKASCVANAFWLVAWHYEFLILSVVIMVCLLFFLVRIYIDLQAPVPGATILDRLLLHLPFSLYTAWISVAILANVSAVQNGYGWDDFGFDAVTWTLLKLGLAGAVMAGVVVRRADPAFALVVAWAAYGISVKQAATPDVAGAAVMLSMLAVLLVVFDITRRFLARARPPLSTARNSSKA
jgi:hypothetical protein